MEKQIPTSIIKLGFHLLRFPSFKKCCLSCYYYIPVTCFLSGIHGSEVKKKYQTNIIHKTGFFNGANIFQRLI